MTMKKMFKALCGRLAITCYLILIQLILLFVSILIFANNYIYFYIIMIVFSLFLIIAIINDDSNPTFKMAWLIPMLIFPIFGAPLYIIFGRKKVSKRITKKLYDSFLVSNETLPADFDILNEIKEIDVSIYTQFNYIFNTSNSNVYKNSRNEYIATGEIFYRNLIDEMERAKKFIFLEYFIISKGEMWNTVLELLKRKVKQGVDVRLIYDDLGTINSLEKNYCNKLNSYGIKTSIFNPFHASLDSFLNYRDHRKITIIDGNVGFTGGINLADEYINVVKRFGHWKDSSVMIKGDAVTRLTIMFLQIWYFLNPQDEKHYKEFFNTVSYENDGYVQPFSDSPISGHLTGELSYMNMINNAYKYVYITTPYLILDNEMITALKLAVESGIEVRIVTPNIPDKWYVHHVTRANYPQLLKAGVRIFEYTPGFIHAKTIVVDDELAIVGTTNFDFRSFYLHFENGVLMYKSKCVLQVKEEYDRLLEDCNEITLEKYNSYPWIQKIKRKKTKNFFTLLCNLFYNNKFHCKNLLDCF